MAEVTRIIELQDMLFYFQEGFDGTSAVDDATIAASDTVIGVDTHVLRDTRTVVPVGARFTTAGIATVRTVTATQNSTQYTLDMTAPTAGTFTVTHNSNTTSALAYDLTASAFQTALEGLASIGAGNVTVTETTDVYTITFAGTLANTVQTITVDGTGLTASNSHVLTQTQDGTTTWEVTFSPAIVAGSVPSDNDVITWYPRLLEFEPEGGEFEWTQTRERVIRKPRGIIKGSRKGVEQEMVVTTSFPFEFLRAQTTAVLGAVNHLTPYEVLEQEGFAADWMPSANGGVCEPYSIDLKIVDKPSCSSEQAQVWIFPQFDYTDLSPTVSEGIINLTGSCVAKKPITYRCSNNDDAIGVLYKSGQTPT